MTDATTEHDRPVPAGSDPDEVRLALPCQNRYLRLARLTAAGMAADLGYGTDALEDLRIAVDELSAAVIDGVPPSSELVLTYREVDGALEVVGVCAASAQPPELHGVARELLAMLADEYDIGSDDRGRYFRLVKRRPSDP